MTNPRTRNGGNVSDLQLCTADPRDVEGAMAALGSVASLTGVHQRVTVRSYGRSRRPAIRTLLVRTDPDGHIEIAALGGTYRYLIVGGGTAELHIASKAGTLVDILDASEVSITTTDISIDVTARAGITTITTDRDTRGQITVERGALCTISGTGPGLHITRRDRTTIVAVPEHLANQIIARIPADPWAPPDTNHHEGSR